MEMLTRIPDMNSRSDGGWLFEYEEEPLLKDEPVVLIAGGSGPAIKLMLLSQLKESVTAWSSCSGPRIFVDWLLNTDRACSVSLGNIPSSLTWFL
jgi:hypothetical protein